MPLLKRLYSRPEEVFLVFGVVFGCLFLYLTPVFRVPDEPNHLMRAYQVSTLHFLPSRSGSEVGGNIPTSLVQLGSSIDLVTAHSQKLSTDQALQFHTNGGQEQNGKKRLPLWQDIRQLSGQPLMPHDTAFVHFENTAIYSPLMYAPQAIGIDLGRLLRLAPIWLFILGRLMNLVVYLALIYWAIRVVPFGRWAMAAMALTPMALQQAASLSPDAITIALAFVSLAYSIRLITAHELPVLRDWVLVYVIAFLLGLCKQPVFLLTMLLLARFTFGNRPRRRYFLYALGAVVTSVVVAALWTIISQPFFSVARMDIVVAPGAQVSFILHNPLRYAHIIVRTWLSSWGDLYVVGFIGNLGWLELPVRLLAVVVGYVTILGALAIGFTEAPRLIISRWQRLSAGVLLLGLVVVTMTLLYLTWNPVGASLVDGIQARYFIPLSPLAIILFANRQIGLRRGSRLTAHVVLIGTLVVLVSTVLQMRFYYY